MSEAVGSESEGRLKGNLPEATASRRLAEELAANTLRSTVHNIEETEIQPTGEIRIGDIILRRDEANARYEVVRIGLSQSGRRIDVRVEPVDGGGKGTTLWEQDLLEKLNNDADAWSRA